MFDDYIPQKKFQKPVPRGLANDFGRMIEGWCLSYRCGSDKIEQIIEDPIIKQTFKQVFYRWLDEYCCTYPRGGTVASRENLKPVSRGLAKKFRRMVEDWCIDYQGGTTLLREIKDNLRERKFFKRLFCLWLNELGDSRMTINPKNVFWKTITFGGMSLKQFKVALYEQGVRVYPSAGENMDSKIFRTELRSFPTPESIHIGWASLQQLGLKFGAKSSESFERLRELGFEPLPRIAAAFVALAIDRYGAHLHGRAYMEPFPCGKFFLPVFCYTAFKEEVHLEAINVEPEEDGGCFDSDKVFFRLPNNPLID